MGCAVWAMHSRAMARHAPDRVQGAAAPLAQPFEVGEGAVDDVGGGAPAATGFFAEPEHAQRQRRVLAERALADRRQFEAAATEVGDNPVGVGNRAEHPECRQLRLLATAQNLDRNVVRGLDRGYEGGAVGGFANGRRGQDVHGLDLHGARQSNEAPDGRGRQDHPRLVQASAAFQALAKRAHSLLVEDRQRRSQQGVVDDQADRIGTDVDDGDQPTPLRPSLPVERRHRLRQRQDHSALLRQIELEARCRPPFKGAAASRQAGICHEEGMGAEGVLFGRQAEVRSVRL